MPNAHDDGELVALIANEQRSFRTILTVGVVALMLLVAMSAGLGFYYSRVADSAREFGRQAFQIRRDLDGAINRVSDQSARVRQIEWELRHANAGGSDADEASALAAARNYLSLGFARMAEERAIDGYTAPDAVVTPQNSAAPSTTDQPASLPTQSLLKAVAGLQAWNRQGGAITADTGMPQALRDAQANFQLAAAEAPNTDVAALAHTGLAWIRFIYAGSALSNYKRADCDAVDSEITAIGPELGPRAFYWRAQCARKTGQTAVALTAYAQSLQALGSPQSSTVSFGQRAAAQDAFHGLGTTLIAAQSLPQADPAAASALNLARGVCGGDANASRIDVAIACLQHAMVLRRAAQQTQNQVDGTLENLSFAYLAKDDFKAAYDNAQTVHATAMFPWTELVRAITAKQLQHAEVADEATRNVSYFRVSEFNICELQALMKPALFSEATSIIQDTHVGEQVSCRHT